MKKIEVYDPAMCCSTGVCGPNVNTELLRMATVLETLKKKGADVARFNLSGDPQAFVENTLINNQLKEHGPEVLPITIVDGQIAKSKTYPSNEELSQWTGIVLDDNPKEGGCCCGDGCCS